MDSVAQMDRALARGAKTSVGPVVVALNCSLADVIPLLSGTQTNVLIFFSPFLKII